MSQGNTCDSIIVDQTAPGGVEAVVSLINADCCHLSDREQVRLWAYNSGEALKWLWNIGEQAGAQMVDSTAKWTSNISNINGYDVTYFAFDFGPKPYNTGNGMRDIADWPSSRRRDFLLHPGRPARAGRVRRRDRASSPRAPTVTSSSMPPRASSWPRRLRERRRDDGLLRAGPWPTSTARSRTRPATARR